MHRVRFSFVFVGGRRTVGGLVSGPMQQTPIVQLDAHEAVVFAYDSPTMRRPGTRLEDEPGAAPQEGAAPWSRPPALQTVSVLWRADQPEIGFIC
jgi:hypothetical protein